MLGVCWNYVCFIKHGGEAEGLARRGWYSMRGRILLLMWELRDIACVLPPPTLPPVHKISMTTCVKSCNWEPLSLRVLVSFQGFLEVKWANMTSPFDPLNWDYKPQKIWKEGNVSQVGSHLICTRENVGLASLNLKCKYLLKIVNPQISNLQVPALFSVEQAMRDTWAENNNTHPLATVSVDEP